MLRLPFPRSDPDSSHLAGVAVQVRKVLGEDASEADLEATIGREYPQASSPAGDGLDW